MPQERRGRATEFKNGRRDDRRRSDAYFEIETGAERGGRMRRGDDVIATDTKRGVERARSYVNGDGHFLRQSVGIRCLCGRETASGARANRHSAVDFYHCVVVGND